MLNADRTTKSVGSVLSMFMRKINCDARYIKQPVIEKLSVKAYREPAFLLQNFWQKFLTVVVSALLINHALSHFLRLIAAAESFYYSKCKGNRCAQSS